MNDSDILDVTTDLPAEPEPVRADERFAISPMERRFLFVDVAAQRAKQLRKGALNRLSLAAAAGDTSIRDVGQKPERIAMEEVRRGFIQYDLPEATPPQTPQEG
jgi:DNA-directed RNA polymerase subunit K/omega